MKGPAYLLPYGRLGVSPYCTRNARVRSCEAVDANPDVLIFYAYRYSEEIGRATEAVLKGKPTKDQVKKLYRLLKRTGGKHFSEDVYLALIAAVRRGLADGSS